MGLKLFARRKRTGSSANRNGRGSASASDRRSSEYSAAPVQNFDRDPLKRLAQQGRFNLLLREQDKYRDSRHAEAQIRAAQKHLEQQVALVPAGSVTLGSTLTNPPGAPETDVEVEPFLLDVHCVTNAQYQKFVDAGGYDDLPFWPEEIWPHLIELKDLKGEPAPRFWRNGRHDLNTSNQPVVGISWYEAQAFALWAGLRLATEAEWQMAASWHINSSADLMRRFPWGDAMDNARCNIWSSHRHGTVPVTDYPNGDAPNQVRQLIGNVWEWTDSEYSVTDDDGRPIVGEMPMHVIRGGAFDTYFETQATNYFRTGQIALARTVNTGFRCAMDLNDASWLNGE